MLAYGTALQDKTTRYKGHYPHAPSRFPPPPSILPMADFPTPPDTGTSPSKAAPSPNRPPSTPLMASAATATPATAGASQLAPLRTEPISMGPATKSRIVPPAPCRPTWTLASPRRHGRRRGRAWTGRGEGDGTTGWAGRQWTRCRVRCILRGWIRCGGTGEAGRVRGKRIGRVTRRKVLADGSPGFCRGREIYDDSSWGVLAVVVLTWSKETDRCGWGPRHRTRNGVCLGHAWDRTRQDKGCCGGHSEAVWEPKATTCRQDASPRIAASGLLEFSKPRMP